MCSETHAHEQPWGGSKVCWCLTGYLLRTPVFLSLVKNGEASRFTDRMAKSDVDSQKAAMDDGTRES